MDPVLICRLIELGGIALLIGLGLFLHIKQTLPKARLLRILCLILCVVYLGGISYIRYTNADLAQGAVTDLSIPAGSYTGTVKNGIPSGNGVLTTTDGSVITGVFVDGKATGSGTIRLADGNTYRGQLANNQMNGNGILAQQKGGKETVYAGSFKAGVLVGKGSIIYPDKSTYEGEIVNLLPNGNGTMVLADGSTYVGHFVSGLFHGEGVFTCKSCGHTYTGSFICGMMQGTGTLKMANGTEYTGTWLRDTLNNRLFWCASPYYATNKQLALGEPFVQSLPDFYQNTN